MKTGIMKDNKAEYGFDWGLFIVTCTLMLFGLVMVYSATAVESATDSIYSYNSYYHLVRQLRGVILGFICVFIIIKFNIEFIKKLSVPLTLLSIIALVAVLIVGVERNGARRWIEIGFSLQPSELCKFTLVLFMAAFISHNRKRIKNFWKGILPLSVVAGIMFILIEEQPDLGTILVIALTFMFMLYIGGARKSHMLFLTIGGILVVIKAIINKPYRLARIMAFWNPWVDSQGVGYHIIQSLLAFGSGGLCGRGFGQSRQKLFYLPEHHTDFIFAVIGEELGLIGSLFTVMLFFVFAYKGFKIALAQKETFQFLLTAGMTASIVFQALLNMGVASGCLPLTGVPLPFISFGSTSMIVSLVSVGIILKISSMPPGGKKKSSEKIEEKNIEEDEGKKGNIRRKKSIRNLNWR